MEKVNKEEACILKDKTLKKTRTLLLPEARQEIHNARQADGIAPRDSPETLLWKTQGPEKSEVLVFFRVRSFNHLHQTH